MAGEFETNTIPLGFCQCGCGRRTTIAKRTNADRGAVKGQPRRFVHGHATKGRKQDPAVIARRAANHPGKCKPGCTCCHHSAEARKKVGDATRGRKHSTETLQRMSEAQLKRFAEMSPEDRESRRRKIVRAVRAKRYKPSKLEIRVRDALTEMGIPWIGEQVVAGFCPDLVLPALDAVLEVQGCFWHGCADCFPERAGCDSAKRDRLKRRVYPAVGYRMIEVWEYDLEANMHAALKGAIYGR